MRTNGGEHEDHEPFTEPIPFPADADCDGGVTTGAEDQFSLAGLPQSAEHVYEAIDAMSRRIDDLARELKCLGYFNDDDDGPRAA